MVVACSYLGSVGLVQAANEAGLKPKTFGGAMVGLQATAVKGKLGPELNGIVNYETWVPSKKLITPAAAAFFKQYRKDAKGNGIDPLGYYVGGWGYAYIEVLGDAVQAKKRLNDTKLAHYIHTPTFGTVMGKIKFGKNGERAHSRMPEVQDYNIKPGSGLKTFAEMNYQTIIGPSKFKIGNMIYPYAKVREVKSAQR